MSYSHLTLEALRGAPAALRPECAGHRHRRRRGGAAVGSIGEGTRLAIVDQFSQFGTNTVAVNPGKIETMGMPGVMGGTVKPITLG